MKLVGKGNLDVKTSVQSTDEIGMMSMEFNRMLDQIEHLLEKVKEEQLQKKDAELRAVKHRINPHFLFNTLSTIRWLVKFKQVDRANTALSALSRLLEANMGKKGTFVTITEEIEIIEKFISILQIRYEQTFYLSLAIDDDVADFQIPQMLLQPIVENAIFHGIVPTGREGLIHISGQKVEDGVEIMIRDNGVGFDKGILDQIQQAKELSGTSIGIGLLHVFESVKLYFMPESSIDITSSSEGTVIKLLLKSQHRGGNHV
jgi:two-component system, sensor histidine kinase YesM